MTLYLYYIKTGFFQIYLSTILKIFLLEMTHNSYIYENKNKKKGKKMTVIMEDIKEKENRS